MDSAVEGSEAAPVLLDALMHQHRELDSQVRELSSRPYLSSGEEVELARLKKLKLAVKDRIFALEQEHTHAQHA